MGNPFCTRCGENLTGLVGAAPPPSAAPPPVASAPPAAAYAPYGYGVPPYPYAYTYPPYGYVPPPIRRADALSMFSAMFHAWGEDALGYIVVYLVLGAINVGVALGITYLIVGFSVLPGTFPAVPGTIPIALLEFLIIAFVLEAAISAVVTALFTASVTFFAISKRRGTRVSWPDAFRKGAQRFLSVLGGSLLLALLTIGALAIPLTLLFAGIQSRSLGLLFAGACAFLLAIPVVVFLLISLSLYAPAAMMEGVGAVESLSRSWAMTKGRRWSIFGATILVGVVAFIVELAVTIPAAMAADLLVSSAAQVVAAMITGAWSVLLSAMAYELIAEERRGWGFPSPTVPPPTSPS